MFIDPHANDVEAQRMVLQAAMESQIKEQNPECPRLNNRKFTQEELATKLGNKPEMDIPTYVLQTSGFTPGDTYDLYYVNNLLAMTYAGPWTLNSKEQFIQEDNGINMEGYIISPGGFTNGEFLSIVLLSVDKKFCIATSITPNPIEYTWQDNASINLHIVNKLVKDFRIICRGFQPGEVISFFMYGNKIGSTTITSFNPTVIPLSIEAIDASGGHLMLRVERTKNSEQGLLKFWWGDQAPRKSKLKTFNKIMPSEIPDSCSNEQPGGFKVSIGSGYSEGPIS